MTKLLLISLLHLAESYINNGLQSVSITRHHKGDIFIAQGEKCYKDLCVSMTGGTAEPTGNGECECKCSPHYPIFRDDINICVNDIQECSLLPFVSSSAIKKIPYVFLPLKGQIVYPSADIIISEAKTPVCVVSGGQFLGQRGWLNLRNHSRADIPFTLFRDEGRTYLQWIGESSLRMALEGRIILVHLMCKDASLTEEPKIFTPCIAFRVAGNPNVKEVIFAADVHPKEEFEGSLSLREYIAIGICSLLLVMVYVVAVFLYLHFRKRKHKKGRRKSGDAHLALGEEGIIKSNPLLQATRHLSLGGQDNAGYISESNSCCSETDQTSELLPLDDEDLTGPQNMQTSAIIHPFNLDYGEVIINQDSNNIEKLPEENVSIVETLEIKENHPETIRAMSYVNGVNGRRKLYFNPSYFEPDLLKAPPPAAVEFLVKIREVIAIAKHKMSAKKFSPSLLGIPEEDGSSKSDYGSTRKDLSVAEKSETRKSPRLEKLPEGNFHFISNELCCHSDTKQKIIRKWLEDVPVMILNAEECKSQKAAIQENKMLQKSNLWQTDEENASTEVPVPPARQEKKKTKGRAPPVPPLKTELHQEPKFEKDFNKSGYSANAKFENVAPPQPPPMPSFEHNFNEVPRVQGKNCVQPASARNLMDAVIQELTSFKKNDKNSKLKELTGRVNCTAKENNDNHSQELSISGQSATMQNFQEKTHQAENSIQDLKDNTKRIRQDDHEYEVILLNADHPVSEGKDIRIYNLPDFLCKNDKSEGYSLVSEVYVNEGYSCCSGESPPSSDFNTSVESEKIHYDVPNEKPGQLTIHVNGFPERYRTSASESDNFEPDTLDRKPRKSKPAKKKNEESERYSNQKFHDMDYRINSPKSENFTDSLERPSIRLKTNGTFKRNSLEKEINELFRNFSWSNVESVGSLREIYEAKSRSHKRKAETSSLIAMDNHSDNDRFSTLSWSEERKNKLLHRGIVLHIKEKEPRKHKPPKCKAHVAIPPKVPSRPPKPFRSPRSRSASPVIRSNCASPSSGLLISPRSTSPPLPPPRSLPASSLPRTNSSPSLQIQPRSKNNSPVTKDRGRNSAPSPPYSPSNSVQKDFKSSNSPRCSSPILSQSNSLSSFPSISPPPRPPKTVYRSPLLPPRNTKPPLPPKNVKRYPKPGKFAGRPLPPLPRLTTKDYFSSPLTFRDSEALSTNSGASLDSLNSSDYEAFYTLPYDEEEEVGCNRSELMKKIQNASSNAITVVPSPLSPTLRTSRYVPNQRSWDPEKKPCRGTNKAIPHRQEDSGYLSTDSDSYCPQLMYPSNSTRIIENSSQNSETEESLCDGASESGGESIATDSFFYGNFKKRTGNAPENSAQSEIQPYSLRLSDVEVNSDTERHCVPIMVRP